MTHAITLDTLRTSLTAAEAHAAAAQASFEAVANDENDDNDIGHVVDWSIQADEDLDAARSALRIAMIRGDVPRTWTVTDETGCVTETLDGELTSDEAERAAEDWVRDASDCYDTTDGTIWVDARVRCEATGEDTTITVTLDPEEPACSEAEHDWQSPHSILGGLEENPGVWGHGGGVIIREVCMHCGCERTTDTWATRHDNGVQGLESVSYAPGKFGDEVAALRDEDADA